MSLPRPSLVRYGETDRNAAGRLLSSMDQPLDARGEAQDAELRLLISTILRMPPAFAAQPRMRDRRPAIVEPRPRPLLPALDAGDPAFEAGPVEF